MSNQTLRMLGLFLVLALANFSCAQESKSPLQDSRPLLLQNPTLSKTQIAFGYGGDIWIVDRNGGDAQRLVTGMDVQNGPYFSPDGSMVAYTAAYDNNVDVYVVPASGGEPRRLTYHPSVDVAVGWSPDGKSVLFRSTRSSYTYFNKLFTIPVEGGFPTELPLPTGVQGSYSSDGSHIAYVPFWYRGGGAIGYSTIKHYRGGMASPIWIADLSDSSIVKIPREDSNDYNPMWVGDKVYFLSDRNGVVGLFTYDTKSKSVKQVVDGNGSDLKSASAGPGAIVYEQLGSLHLYDLDSAKDARVEVRVAGDMPQVRPHFEKVSDQIRDGEISPTGQRALFEAHGQIFTVPKEKGDIRRITKTSGVANRSPAWSPDGQWIAYLSDQDGEYALYIVSQDGMSTPRKIDLGEQSFFYSPTWSPDSKKIAYSDKRLNLWYVDIDHPKPVKVDTDLFDSPVYEFNETWSADSRWLTYNKQLENHFRAVFVYSLEDHKATQITDGMSDALCPSFDKSGKYLYFLASTDMALTTGWLDMTSYDHPVTQAAYVAVLRKDLPSPLAPESDDEKPPGSGDDASTQPSTQPSTSATTKKDEDKSKPNEATKVTIDFENLSQRILALPIPASSYSYLTSGKEGIVYLAEAPQFATEDIKWAVQRFELKTRKTAKIVDGVDRLALSDNGEKILYRKDNNWYIGAADDSLKPGDGQLKLDDMEVQVDPPAEWRQMFNEIWRIERDFFYDPHYHGLNIKAAQAAYEPFLAGVASRSDLNYLFADMLANFDVLHMFVGGGTQPDLQNIQVGLLGADYAVDHGRYRFARIYNGENWNVKLQAPLTQPGVNVKEGEYLLAVNGRDLRLPDNIYSFFQETAGKQVVLRVGPNADGSGARDVTVVPVDSEFELRNLAWIEDNRRKVDQLSGGKLAYVYLPNTATAGYSNFNRYYFAQVGKEGAILDERFNGGGDLADYIVDYLRRPVMSLVETREGETYKEPMESIFGPKTMIINEHAGSGGDALPWYFRKAGIGPLVGTRTWGGLVGIGGYPQLIDGGFVTAPRWAIYGTSGQWEVENHGITPDIEVELDPKLVREGHDPQLEKAVEVTLQALKDHPLPTYQQPAYPDYHQKY